MSSRMRTRIATFLLVMLAAGRTSAQLQDAIPHASYFAAAQAFYYGEYRSAERELRREAQHGVRAGQSRWIDSICYHAMLGEALFHEGRNAEALASFDEACQLFAAYPNWLLQVKFQTGPSGPRVDTNRARRVPPWGRSSRNFVLGQFPETEQVLIGDLDANRAFQQGGVVREPMFWRVNVVEIMRMTALAIQRRNEILGPIAPQDAISKQLSAVLTRTNLTQPNHWTIAWIDLLRGLAQEGMGKLDEADLLLNRSLIVNGQLDHPLTGVALLAQGRIAAKRGDLRRAAQNFAEAGFSAFYFEDWGTLTDATLAGWLNHMASGAAGVYPPLDAIASAAQSSRIQHTAVKVRLAQAESLLWRGEVASGAAIVDEAARRMGEMRGGLPAIHQLHLQAVVHLLQNKAPAGGETLTRALAAQAGASLRNFQIQRTSELYDSRAASPRVAVDLYKSLLADPSPVDWTRDPLDAMAVMQTNHSAAFERWFVAALERKEPALALEIAERTKRRQFLSSQPFGGRLLALRGILETPVAELSQEAVLQRQRLLTVASGYQALADAGTKFREQLLASAILPTKSDESKAVDPIYDAWDRNVQDRQRALIQLAVRRLPTSNEFPPLRTTVDLQKSLGDGETLLEFHTAANNLYGFVMTASDTRIWQLPESRRLRAGLGDLLKALGNYSANRQLTIAELKDPSWREASKAAYAALLTDAKLDLKKIKSLIIVPDDLLWYLPFEVLIPGEKNGDKVLADLLPLRYGPTAALAVSRPQPLRRPQHTAIIAHDVKFGGDDTDRSALVQELEKVFTGPVVMGETLPQPPNLVAALVDHLINLDSFAPNAEIGAAPTLLPRAKGANKDALNAWIHLPAGGPEQVVLTGVSTEAEQGLKTSKRNPRVARPGSETFLSLCAMMADGARTILMTRWRTSGRTNFDLVREFAKESANTPAAAAWQRACLLAREAPLDVTREPRLQRASDSPDLPTADHPFFWAGYLLVDTGPQPTAEPTPPPEETAKDTKEAKTSGEAKDSKDAKNTPIEPDAKKPPSTDAAKLPPPAKDDVTPKSKPNASGATGTASEK